MNKTRIRVLFHRRNEKLKFVGQNFNSLLLIWFDKDMRDEKRNICICNIDRIAAYRVNFILQLIHDSRDGTKADKVL